MAHNTKRKQRGKILVYGRDVEPLIDNPRADEEWIHSALLAWGRWCKERKVRGKCNSIEHRYVAPKGNIWNPPEPREPVNLLLANEVNSAMIELPEQTRDILAARYFLRLTDQILCRRFRLKEDSYPKFIRGARLMLQSILLKRRDECILTPHNSTPSSTDETLMPKGRASLSVQKVVS